MSEMISTNGAVRDPNVIAAEEENIDSLPEISMEEAMDILEETGPILTDATDSTKLDDLQVSLSSSLEQLNNVRSELTASGYINRSEAAMLKNLTASAESITGFFERHPISSFTEMDSKVNYAVTCESIGKSIIDTMVTIIKTIYKYIVSIGKWFIAFLTGRRRKDQQNDQADKAIEKKNQELDRRERTPLQADRIATMVHKMQPQYTRLVEIMSNNPSAGAGDPLSRAELLDFTQMCASSGTLLQLNDAKGAKQFASITIIEEEPQLVNQYGRMSKVCHALNLMPLNTLCNYPGMLAVVKQFRAHIEQLANKPSESMLDEPSINVLRTFNKDNSHLRFNSLLPTIQSAVQGNELVLKTIDDSTTKLQRTNSVPDDFFISRQRAAAQVKEKQLVLQELTQIQSMFATARDRSSQIVLEYARARTE